VVSSFAPIWVLIGLGYLVGRAGVLGAAATDVLGRFVLLVAMPAALFGTLSRAPLAGFGLVGLLAFAASTFLVGSAGFALARWGLRRTLGEQTIAGMAAGYVNAGNLGIPVAVQILGDASFVAVVLLFQVLVLAPVVLCALDAGTGSRPGFRRVLTLPVRNPILLACVCGVAVHSAGWKLPDLVYHPVDLLGAAAVPLALVALGLSLHRRRGDHPDPPAGERRRLELIVVVGLKIVVQPAVAYLVGHVALGLDGAPLLAVVVCAALPTAQNTFVFARVYGLQSRLPRDSVVWTTAFSMITLTAVATLLSG